MLWCSVMFLPWLNLRSLSEPPVTMLRHFEFSTLVLIYSLFTSTILCSSSSTIKNCHIYTQLAKMKCSGWCLSEAAACVIDVSCVPITCKCFLLPVPRSHLDLFSARNLGRPNWLIVETGRYSANRPPCPLTHRPVARGQNALTAQPCSLPKHWPNYVVQIVAIFGASRCVRVASLHMQYMNSGTWTTGYIFFPKIKFKLKFLLLVLRKSLRFLHKSCT